MIVPSLLMAPQARSRAEDFVTEVPGKKVVGAQDRAGVVANALLVPGLLGRKSGRGFHGYSEKGN